MKSVVFRRGIFVTSIILCLSLNSVCEAALTATSTAEQIDESGSIYYKYTISLDWDFTAKHGISNWAMDLNPTLLCPYALKDEDGELTGNIWFEDPTSYVAPSDGQTYPYLVGIDGLSTPENGDTLDVMWFGSADLNPSVGNGVKYEQPLMYDSGNPGPQEPLEPGNVGSGQFWFYSIFAPISGSWDDALYAKAGRCKYTGSISGDLPYCAPEPATLLLISLGAVAFVRRKS